MSFYIVKEGNVLVRDSEGKELKKVGPGEEFGFDEFCK